MKDAIVIGGGPAGFTAAAEITMLSGTVTLIEKDELGGVCLNRGCMPTKCMIHDVKENRAFDEIYNRKEKIVNILRRSVEPALKHVEVIKGEAKIKDKNTVVVNDEEYSGKNIVIAVGSENVSLPNLQSDAVVDSDKLLELEKLPKTLAVIGGGAIGCEFACVFNKLGTKVEIIEMQPHILSFEDDEISIIMERVLRRQGIIINTSSKVIAITGGEIEFKKGRNTEKTSAEVILMSIGRKPIIPQELEKLGVKSEKTGIIVNKKMQTSVPNIYAVGDCIGGIMLAHAATHEARVAAKNIMGQAAEIREESVPSATYTTPEVASVGLTEQQANEKGLDINVGGIPLTAIGMSRVLEERDGYAKVIFDKKAKKIVGVHLVGAHVVDIIGSASALMNVPYEKLQNVVFPHPSISEILYESLLNAIRE